MTSLLQVSTFCIVTGASRGIGRAIAIQLARRVNPASSIYLTARSKGELQETERLMKVNTDDNLVIRCFPSDLSDEGCVDQLTNTLFQNLGNISKYSHAMLVNNAGSLGPLTKYSREINNVQEIQRYCLLNITAPIMLTSRFLQCFGKSTNLRKTIVQLTSRSGVLPQKTMHMYGMGKAARDMFLRVVAVEEPDVRTMIFNPGFVDTAMYTDLQQSVDSDFRDARIFLSEQPYFLTPEQTAGAMLKAIEDDKYESGETVLSYDVMNIDITK